MAGILFEDIFDVKDIDPDGKKFDRGVWNAYSDKSRQSKFLSIAQFGQRTTNNALHVHTVTLKHIKNK